MEVLNILTKRLIIRELMLTDLSDFHIYRSNPEVTKYQGFDVFTLEQAKHFILDNHTKHFGKADEWIHSSELKISKQSNLSATVQLKLTTIIQGVQK